MKLDSKQCEAILAVIDCGSFDLAAASLHITASAVSQRVRALEISLGAPLVVRSRPCRATPAGQRLLQTLRRMQLLEDDLAADFSGGDTSPLTIPVAVNADSLGSWFLPALVTFLIREHVLLDLTVDDQDHTYTLLEAGHALGCISTEPQAMRGCVVEPLGTMLYRCMASSTFRTRWFANGMTRDTARLAPVMTFNRKDALQSDFLLQHFGLPADSYPCHYVPASEPYLQAIQLGLGWGMLPEIQARDAGKNLVDLMPAHPVAVSLYWHRWKVQSPRMERMSATLTESARTLLA